MLELWLVDSKHARIVIDIIIKKHKNCWITLIKLRKISSSLDKQIIDEKYEGLYQSIVTRISKVIKIEN